MLCLPKRNTLLRNGQQQAAWESLAALASIEGNSPRFQQLKQAFDRGQPLNLQTVNSLSSNTPSTYQQTSSPQASSYSRRQSAPSDPDFFETVGVDSAGDNRREVRGDLLNDVAESWLRPNLTIQATAGPQQNMDPLIMMQKLNSIVIPTVFFCRYGVKPSG